MREGERKKEKNYGMNEENKTARKEGKGRRDKKTKTKGRKERRN